MKPDLTSGLLAAGIVLCIAGVILLQPGITRERAQFAHASEPLSQAPPELVVANTALGGFRGLLVDLVWLRAIELERRGQFWELLQLYDWVGKLEPYHDEIWTNKAWYMSYNFVAQLRDSEERWQWIWRAVESLRDEGLKYNPRSVEIHRELAWIFCHKMGGYIDEHHWYYMHRFALMFMDETGVQGQLNVPLVAKAPETAAALNNLLLEKAGEPLRWFFGAGDDAQFNVLEAYLALKADPNRAPPERLSRAQDEPLRTCWATIENFLVAERLRQVFKLDPQRMLRLEKEFGAMDWRLPEPHAIYWAVLGLERADAANVRERVKLQRDIIITSLKALFRRGAIFYLDRDPYSVMDCTWSFEYLNRLELYYRKLIDEYKAVKDETTRAISQSFHDGHMSFLEEALAYLYCGGFESESQRYYQMLVKDYPRDRWQKFNLEEYALSRLTKEIEEEGNDEEVHNLVELLLVSALTNMSVNRLEETANYETVAEKGYRLWRDERMKARSAMAPNIHIPTFDELRNAVLLRVLNGYYRHVSTESVLWLRDYFQYQPPAPPEEAPKIIEEKGAAPATGA